MWLADEVRDLINAQLNRDDLAKIVEAKLLLDGFVASQERAVA
jgi:hypothetical protein